MTKLIILRGPSGAGKSTTARMLQRQSSRKIAVVEQDYYKEVMFNDRESSVKARHEMVINDVLIALQHGFDVILDGIFSLPSHQETFQKLFAQHPDDNYLYFFDISLDETLRRHQTRWQKDHFGESEMRSWYNLATRTNYMSEIVISDNSTIEQTVMRIRKETGI